METPYLSLDIEYTLEHDRKENKLKCVLSVSEEWPIFANYGKTIFQKYYSHTKTFRCKPKQFEAMLHGFLGRARGRLAKLRKVQAKYEALSEYDLSVTTYWGCYYVEKREQHREER